MSRGRTWNTNSGVPVGQVPTAAAGYAQSFNRGAEVFLADERGASSDGPVTGKTAAWRSAVV
jgi:hypothetical protein